MASSSLVARSNFKRYNIINKCSHTVKVDGYWEYYIDEDGDEQQGTWVDPYYRPTHVDESLYVYKCTQCNERFNY